MDWAFTIAALLMRISIWKVPSGLLKCDFAASISELGADGSRRSARIGTALILYVVERWVANSFAVASEENVA